MKPMPAFDPTNPHNNVLVVAQNPDDHEPELAALRLLLQLNEPTSHFAAPQITLGGRSAFEGYGRLRILQTDDSEDISRDSGYYFAAYMHFHERGLPIAYHTLILTTT